MGAIKDAFPDLPYIDLTGGGVKKAQGSIDLSATQEMAAVEEDVPTSSNLKAEIYDYLVARGEDPDDLDGLTKAELLELV